MVNTIVSSLIAENYRIKLKIKTLSAQIESLERQLELNNNTIEAQIITSYLEPPSTPTPPPTENKKTP